MTKNQILSIYNACTKPQKDRITAAARAALREKGVYVGRTALDYWRKREMKRSPLERFYLAAYKKAIQNHIQQQSQ